MERLDEFPEVFRRIDPMPWDEEYAGDILWPFGESAGHALKTFSSASLLAKRRQVEAKNGKGNYFAPLLDAIDQVLNEREGL